jgi:hypothetical protein
MTKPTRKQRLPIDWTEADVRKLAAHHDNLSEQEIAAEIEAVSDARGETLVAVPTELVPRIVKLINKNRRAVADRRKKRA